LLVLRSCLSALLDFSCLLVSLRTVLMPCNRRPEPELSEKPFWIVLASKYNPKQSYYFENGIHLPTNPDDLSVTAAVSVASCNCSVLRSVAASESVPYDPDHENGDGCKNGDGHMPVIMPLR
jgi:hypothetical protein